MAITMPRPNTNAASAWLLNATPPRLQKRQQIQGKIFTEAKFKGDVRQGWREDREATGVEQRAHK